MEIQRPLSKQPIPPDAKRVFKGVMFEVYQWEQAMFDGSKETFEKLRRPDTVVAFPVLPDGRIIMTEQEQPGKPFFIAAPGGRVDDGEEVLAAVQRELMEETGYQAAEFILWTAGQPASKIDWAVYTFVAKGLKKVGDQELDAGERIKLKIVTLDELLALATDENFAEKEIIPRLLEAKFDPKKMTELRRLFSPEF